MSESVPPVASLSGRTVVVTRPRRQASSISASLRSLGASVVEAPSIEITEPADGGAALEQATSRLVSGEYEWVVVTSSNGAERLGKGLPDGGIPGRTRVAAIGPGTSKTLQQFGLASDLVPDASVGEGLVEAFPEGCGTVLVVQAAVVRGVVAPGIAAKGWEVEVVVAYQTVAVAPSPELVAEIGSADAVTFASPSAANHLIEAVGSDGLPPIVATIGPVTSEALTAHEIVVTVEASPHTIAGLVDAVVSAFATRAT